MMEALLEFLKPEPARKGPMIRVTLGMDPKGCEECSHLPAFVRTVRARSIGDAIDIYAARFPQANPAWAKVMVMSVSKA